MSARAHIPIVVLAGPTAVGKTRVAVELCKRLGGEIVGADSVQVYRGFDIGSGKPKQDELGGVRHHLLDVLDPTERIDAARFAVLADAAIDDVVQRGAKPLIVGGTGLWLRALLRGLVALPAVDPALRAQLTQDFYALGPHALHARLQAVDTQTAARVHPSDMHRVVRALEVYAQTGVALGEWQGQHALGKPRYRSLMLVLDRPEAAWMQVLTERVQRMLSEGWVDEVRALIERYGEGAHPLRSVGYRQIIECLKRGSSASAIEEAVLRATRLYGKRQRTWFRSDPNVDQRIDADAAPNPETLLLIEQHLGSVASVRAT